MNLKHIKSTLIIGTLFISVIGSAQIVNFDYDKSGNRILREIIYLKSQETIDSSDIKQTYEYRCLLGTTNVIVSPNPNGGKFKIIIEGYKPEIAIKITLHSLNGVLVYQNKNAGIQTEVDISNRQNGVYILTLIIGNRTKTWKIIKQ